MLPDGKGGYSLIAPINAELYRAKLYSTADYRSAGVSSDGGAAANPVILALRKLACEPRL